MITYTLSTELPHRQYIQFKATFTHDGSDSLTIQLPAWRPGRYELANFAKNIRKFVPTDLDGNQLSFKKTTKDQWNISAKNLSEVHVNYEFYAAELNAGSTFFNERILYVNPVNCFMYRIGSEENESISVHLNVRSDYILASPLADAEKKSFNAKNVHELMDSPFMTSADLEHHAFEESGCQFHLWINGTHQLDLAQVEADFRPFCKAQIEDFKSIPVDEYLFLFHFLEQNAYHGVEHEKCTVISLGPSKKLLERNFYEELLGVSSHELYHTWNVKAMRPADMLPYDYTQENYSELGYVYEGVTTYMGDWYLFTTGVYSFEQYSRHIGSYFLRHFHNAGRLNYSVSESSFDTWLDGYVAGAPGRKTSIYTEGCLIAFICDLKIIKATDGEKSLVTVMTQLWQSFGEKGKGYTEADYIHALESVSGESFSDILQNLIHGTADFTPYLNEALHTAGMTIEEVENPSKFTSNTGLKVSQQGNGDFKIVSISENSPADVNGIHLGDTIKSVNGKIGLKKEELDQLDFSKHVQLSLTHLGQVVSVELLLDKKQHYSIMRLAQIEDKNSAQERLFNQWSKNL